ncbi:hypothetical protein RFI_18224 [Reticulomyxa filosa]|uniref:Uncharacterized protein n=1 Tax=Reticulomyxa filosa TaxID=46433 RepID=X6MZV8_RETFI|nr:hypothetical protein RFI_18224 [Reticulomyxa filosa]|eukprot:ETO19014.1 hypothetical protein RFI_18224 [Reticulomyxa filosa]
MVIMMNDDGMYEDSTYPTTTVSSNYGASARRQSYSAMTVPDAKRAVRSTVRMTQVGQRQTTNNREKEKEKEEEEEEEEAQEEIDNNKYKNNKSNYNYNDHDDDNNNNNNNNNGLQDQRQVGAIEENGTTRAIWLRDKRPGSRYRTSRIVVNALGKGDVDRFHDDVEPEETDEEYAIPPSEGHGDDDDKFDEFFVESTPLKNSQVSTVKTGIRTLRGDLFILVWLGNIQMFTTVTAVILSNALISYVR